MPFALLIVAGIGGLIFFISFFSYVVAGFRHHLVIGLIALLPVLNIVTLPSLWHQHRWTFFRGLLGLITLIVAWVFGANIALSNLTSSRLNNAQEIVLPKTKTTILAERTASPSHNKEMHTLPTKALYTMSFERVSLDKINTLVGRIAKIEKVSGEIVEGRIQAVSTASVIFDSQVEVPINAVKDVKLLLRK